MENNNEVKVEEPTKETGNQKKKPNVIFTLFACLMTGIIVFLATNLGQKASKVVDPATGGTKTDTKEESNSNVTSNVETSEKDITSAESKEKYSKLINILEYLQTDYNPHLFSGNLYLKDEVTVDQFDQGSMFYSAILDIEDMKEIPSNGWTISEDIVLKKVRSLYGDNINLYTNKISGCPTFEYDASNKQYKSVSGCGHSLVAVPNHYIYKVTEKDNNVYVYVAVAAKLNSVEPDTGNGILVVYYDMTETQKYTGNTDGFELTEANYKDFSQYKYTLSKNADGSSRFVKLERIK